MKTRALEPGTSIAWYVVESVLGQGSLGVTYLARDTKTEEQIVLKEYLPAAYALRQLDHSVRPSSVEDAQEFELGLTHFVEEAETLRRIEHPNIVHVEDVLEANHTAYVLMTYEQGESLDAVLARRGLLSETELVRIAIAVLGGLEKVHAAGIIHRDIRECNILIRDDGSPVLLDFGGTRVGLFKRKLVLSHRDQPAGIPSEQLRSDSGPWTDIHALGAILYRTLIGKGGLRSAQEAARARSSYSPALLNVIERALAAKPEDRPNSVTEWRSEFEAVQQSVAMSEAPTEAAPEAAAVGQPLPLVAVAADTEPERRAQPEIPATVAPHIEQLEIVVESMLEVAQVSVASTSRERSVYPLVPVPEQMRRARLRIRAISPTVAFLCVAVFLLVAMLGQHPEPVQESHTAPSSNLVAADTTQSEQATVPATSDDSGDYGHEQEASEQMSISAAVLPPTTGTLERINAVSDRTEQAQTEQAQETPPAALADQATPGDSHKVSVAVAEVPAPVNSTPSEPPSAPAPETPVEPLAEVPAPASATPAEASSAPGLDTPAEPLVELTDRQARINELLAQAEEDVKVLRLMIPKGSNALEKYQEVSKLEPDNQRAAQGLETISERYVELAYSAMSRKRYRAAERYLSRAEQVTPGSDAVKAAQETLAEKKRRASNATAVAERTETVVDKVQGLFVPDAGVNTPRSRPESRAEQIRQRWGGRTP